MSATHDCETASVPLLARLSEPADPPLREEEPLRYDINEEMSAVGPGIAVTATKSLHTAAERDPTRDEQVDR